jgi:hypothetical protein
MIEEVGCWNCALDGVKSGKSVCPDCGTERARNCDLYIHEKIQVEKSEMEKGCNGNQCRLNTTKHIVKAHGAERKGNYYVIC